MDVHCAPHQAAVRADESPAVGQIDWRTSSGGVQETGSAEPRRTRLPFAVCREQMSDQDTLCNVHCLADPRPTFFASFARDACHSLFQSGRIPVIVPIVDRNNPWRQVQWYVRIWRCLIFVQVCCGGLALVSGCNRGSRHDEPGIPSSEETDDEVVRNYRKSLAYAFISHTAQPAIFLHAGDVRPFPRKGSKLNRTAAIE